MSEGATLSIDPHVHSEGSYDGHEPVELILEHAADIGLDGVVITDHDRIEESLEAAARAPEYDLVGVPGVEVSTASGHLLAIGVERCPPKGEPYLDTVERVREMGGVAVVPHPFQRTRHGVRKKRLRDADGIEVYNSMLFTGYRNRRANRFAAAEGYPKIGASDAHYLPNVGRAYTDIRLPNAEHRADVDGDRLLAALRDGRTEIAGKRTPVYKSSLQYGKGVVRKSAYLFTKNVPKMPVYPRSMREF